MGLPAPEIIEYPSLAEAVSDFPSWRSRIKQVVPTLWDFQYPVLNPSGYWARYHLFDEGFQFDLTRTANDHGCYVYPHYLSHIPIEPEQLYGRYLAAAIDACRDSTTTPIDQAIASIVDSDDAFLDEILWMRDLEDPTSQAAVESHVFLASQSWLRVEYQMLRDMRAWVNRPVCDQHYQNTRLLFEHDGVFLTFGNLVISTQLARTP